HEHRYWDGSQWTDNVADAGVSASDPFDPVADAPTTVEPAVNPYESPVAPTPDQTAAYPTPPAPPAYVAPSPVSGDGPGNGSKKGLLIGVGVLAAVALAVIAFLALGGDDDDTDGDDIASEDTTTTVDESEDDTTTTTEDDTDSTTTTFDLDEEDPFSDGGLDDL